MLRLLTVFASCVFLLNACGEPPAEEPGSDAPMETPSDTATTAGDDIDQAPASDMPADSQATNAMCGGIAGLTCAGENDFCKFPEGQCNMPDASGTCTAKPEVCTMQYEPVCGCDGQTYGNACEAAAAGVSVMSQGACAGDGTDEAEE